MKLITLYVATAALCLGLTGCQSTAPKPSQTNLSQLPQIDANTNVADHENQSPSWLNHIEAALAAKQFTKARLQLIQTQNYALTEEQRALIGVHWAKLYQATNANKNCLQVLNKVESNAKLDRSHKGEFYQLRAQCYAQAGHNFEAARALIQFDNLIDNAEDHKVAQQQIWHYLNNLSPRYLQAMLQSDKSKLERGWFTLAYISQHSDNFEQDFSNWQHSYRNHPASNFGKNKFPTSVELGAPTQIALILPLSDNPFASAAKAVKDGFMLAYQNAKQTQRLPAIKIYNSHDEAQVVALYQQAVAEGADFVVGPLTKPGLKKIAKLKQVPVPILALNQIDNLAMDPNIFQFGLRPETEAVAVAHHALDKGYKKALIIAPSTALGQRLKTAFRDNFEIGDAKVIETKMYTPGSNLQNSVKNLLGINESQQRAKELSKVLKHSLNFTPEKRKDADLIFLAVPATDARQIVPLLKYYFAADLPVYATSSIYAVNFDNKAFRDLQRVEFCDAPWVVSPKAKYVTERQRLKKIARNNFVNNTRLYGLGLDAFLLSNKVEQLRRYPLLGIVAHNGHLSLETNNIIQRQMVWAKFDRDQIRLIH